jgi:hypothetical protein
MTRTLVAFSAAFLLVACEPERPPHPASQGPPADAQYVIKTPPDIIAEVAKAKGDASEFIGLWNDARGWDGELVAITEEKSGTALRINNSVAGLAGGNYWIVAIVGDNPDVQTKTLVRVQGRIKEVSTTVKGPNIIHRIVLEDARIIK